MLILSPQRKILTRPKGNTGGASKKSPVKKEFKTTQKILLILSAILAILLLKYRYERIEA